MKWIPVTKALPIIPKGKNSISVLVCCYDPIYDEHEVNGIITSNGKGLTVQTVISYGSYINPNSKDKTLQFGFHELFYEGWMPTVDKVTHWMYLPEPPKYKADYNKEKEILEFVYDELK